MEFCVEVPGRKECVCAVLSATCGGWICLVISVLFGESRSISLAEVCIVVLVVASSHADYRYKRKAIDTEPRPD